eukprot:357881-Chlamydomonas_euryale.AAC.28
MWPCLQGCAASYTITSGRMLECRVSGGGLKLGLINRRKLLCSSSAGRSCCAPVPTADVPSA